jgi:transposase-like protein
MDWRRTANNVSSAMIAVAAAEGNPGSNAYSDEERELILRAYNERSSLRGLSRTFGVARNTVTKWIKKSGPRYHR